MINFHSKLVKNTVDLKNNSFPTVDQGKAEADRSFKDLITRRRKL